ncbi:MAG: hypothetical protein WCH52_11210 [Bacteroidota bacterium]
MKFGFRIPNLNKRIAARTSLKRYVRQNMGFKAPRGLGWVTNPKKALYNRVYNRTTSGCMLVIILLLGILGCFILVLKLLLTPSNLL